MHNFWFSTSRPALRTQTLLLLPFMWEIPQTHQKKLLPCLLGGIFSPRNRLAFGRDDPHFFRMGQHSFTSMEYLELLYDSHLFLHYLFPAFLILAPDTGHRTRVNLDSVRIEKAMEAQPRGAMVSVSMNDLGCARAYVSRRFGDGRMMRGVAGKLYDRRN